MSKIPCDVLFWVATLRLTGTCDLVIDGEEYILVTEHGYFIFINGWTAFLNGEKQVFWDDLLEWSRECQVSK